MTYSFTKPDSGPSPRIDVTQLQTDFSQFAGIFSSTAAGVNYNHTALNNKNQGDHEMGSMQQALSSALEYHTILHAVVDRVLFRNSYQKHQHIHPQKVHAFGAILNNHA